MKDCLDSESEWYHGTICIVSNVCYVLVFDRETVDVGVLSNNIRIIAESVAQHIYNLTADHLPNIFTNGLVQCSMFRQYNYDM